jgi:hypothetical protein
MVGIGLVLADVAGVLGGDESLPDQMISGLLPLIASTLLYVQHARVS